MAARGPLLALAELGERPLPQLAIVRTEEDRRKEGQADRLSGVQPANHGLEVAGVVTERPNHQPVAPAQLVERGADDIGQIYPCRTEGVQALTRTGQDLE